jgi:hypothetical protein
MLALQSQQVHSSRRAALLFLEQRLQLQRGVVRPRWRVHVCCMWAERRSAPSSTGKETEREITARQVLHGRGARSCVCHVRQRARSGGGRGWDIAGHGRVLFCYNDKYNNARKTYHVRNVT